MTLAQIQQDAAGGQAGQVPGSAAHEHRPLRAAGGALQGRALLPVQGGRQRRRPDGLEGLLHERCGADHASQQVSPWI
jgi:hypothetical protein